jgi:hypothetical protein
MREPLSYCRVLAERWSLSLVLLAAAACSGRASGPGRPSGLFASSSSASSAASSSASSAAPATSAATSASPSAVAAVSLTVAPFPGVLHGQLDQTWHIRDPGVAYHQTSRSKLKLALETRAGGLVVLRARGQVETVGVFLDPSAKKTGAPGSPAPTPVNDDWTGHWVRDGGDLVLRLETRTGASGSFVHDLRCVRATETVSGKPLDIVRCLPIQAFKGLPWNDAMPKYVRVPLVLSVNGDVHATISGGDGDPRSIVLAPAH